MSKIVFLMIAAGLAAVAVAAIHINDVKARQQTEFQQTEFIQVSVLAEHQAEYEVDEQVIAIPAVSVDIIEDAAQDFQSQSSVPIITYTALPTKEPRPDREEQQGSESLDEIKHDNGQENGNNANQGNNGNGGSNQNNGNSGNGNGSVEDKNQDKDKQKEKDRDKEKDKGAGGGGGNDKAKETKPEKSE
jgi:hypothetical protein